MSQLGLGAMIAYLGGNEKSVKAFTSALNKTISAIEITDKKLRLSFEDGYKLSFMDDGQSCCEHRYMHTDDKLDYYVGAQLLDAEVSEGPTENRDGDPKDSEFLKVKTSKGTFTVVNYNEHNGYYGGFAIRAYAE